jgi:hypothetical protein
MGLIAVAALLAVAPYVALFVQYGSPTPRTPGQIAMIKSGALAVGWDSAERMTPASYAAHFVSEFVMEWMPTLKPRHALNYAALTIPITDGAVRVRRLFGGGSADRLRKSRPSRYCGRGGHAGFCRIFSYELHTEFGWQTTAYPRYYFRWRLSFHSRGCHCWAQSNRRPPAPSCSSS